jgi:hypothetical protein
VVVANSQLRALKPGGGLSKHSSEQKLSSTLPPLYGNQPSILAFGGHIDSDNLQASSYPKEVDLHEYLIFDSSAVEYSPISLVRFRISAIKGIQVYCN